MRSIVQGGSNVTSTTTLFTPGIMDTRVCTSMGRLSATGQLGAVSVIRIVIAGLLFNGLFGMLYSLSGAALSLIGMTALKKTGLFSVTGVSMAAGVLHNLGQLLMAAALIEDLRIFFYFPVLMFSGIAAGILVGIISALMLRALR